MASEASEAADLIRWGREILAQRRLKHQRERRMVMQRACAEESASQGSSRDPAPTRIATARSVASPTSIEPSAFVVPPDDDDGNDHDEANHDRDGGRGLMGSVALDHAMAPSTCASNTGGVTPNWHAGESEGAYLGAAAPQGDPELAALSQLPSPHRYCCGPAETRPSGPLAMASGAEAQDHRYRAGAEGALSCGSARVGMNMGSELDATEDDDQRAELINHPHLLHAWRSNTAPSSRAEESLDGVRSQTGSSKLIELDVLQRRVDGERWQLRELRAMRVKNEAAFRAREKELLDLLQLAQRHQREEHQHAKLLQRRGGGSPGRPNGPALGLEDPTGAGSAAASPSAPGGSHRSRLEALWRAETELLRKLQEEEILGNALVVLSDAAVQCEEIERRCAEAFMQNLLAHKLRVLQQLRRYKEHVAATPEDLRQPGGAAAIPVSLVGEGPGQAGWTPARRPPLGGGREGTARIGRTPASFSTPLAARWTGDLSDCNLVTTPVPVVTDGSGVTIGAVEAVSPASLPTMEQLQVLAPRARLEKVLGVLEAAAEDAVVSFDASAAAFSAKLATIDRGLAALGADDVLLAAQLEELQQQLEAAHLTQRERESQQVQLQADLDAARRQSRQLQEAVAAAREKEAAEQRRTSGLLEEVHGAKEALLAAQHERKRLRQESERLTEKARRLAQEADDLQRTLDDTARTTQERQLELKRQQLVLQMAREKEERLGGEKREGELAVGRVQERLLQLQRELSGKQEEAMRWEDGAQRAAYDLQDMERRLAALEQDCAERKRSTEAHRATGQEHRLAMDSLHRDLAAIRSHTEAEVRQTGELKEELRVAQAVLLYHDEASVLPRAQREKRLMETRELLRFTALSPARLPPSTPGVRAGGAVDAEPAAPGLATSSLSAHVEVPNTCTPRNTPHRPRIAAEGADPTWPTGEIDDSLSPTLVHYSLSTPYDAVDEATPTAVTPLTALRMMRDPPSCAPLFSPTNGRAIPPRRASGHRSRRSALPDMEYDTTRSDARAPSQGSGKSSSRSSSSNDMCRKRLSASQEREPSSGTTSIFVVPQRRYEQRELDELHDAHESRWRVLRDSERRLRGPVANGPPYTGSHGKLNSIDDGDAHREYRRTGSTPSSLSSSTSTFTSSSSTVTTVTHDGDSPVPLLVSRPSKRETARLDDHVLPGERLFFFTTASRDTPPSLPEALPRRPRTLGRPPNGVFSE